MAANFAFALSWQREEFWPEPAPQVAFEHLRGRVNALLSFGKLEPIQYNVGDKLEYLRTGQLLTVVDPPATYRYAGRKWDYVAGARLHLFEVRVRFPAGQSGGRMPLWFAGRMGASDAVYIVYSNPIRIAFCSDHWGFGGVCSAALDVQPGREYRMRFDADRLNSALTVTLDGRAVLETPIPFHVWKDRDVLFGKSPVPWVLGGDFTGEIRDSGR
jgi:hypothetical protein